MGNTLRIVWEDGLVTLCDPGQLRAACPCATCRAQHEISAAEPGGQGEANLAPAGYSPAQAPGAPQITIRGMRPVGNYAYQITFSDGHDTGIFSLELLRELGRPEG